MPSVIGLIVVLAMGFVVFVVASAIFLWFASEPEERSTQSQILEELRKLNHYR
jgi:hypothetical protein